MALHSLLKRSRQYCMLSFVTTILKRHVKIFQGVVPCCDRCGISVSGQGGLQCVCVCVLCCDRCGGSAGGRGGCRCVFLVVTDVEVVPVDREALSVCSFL